MRRGRGLQCTARRAEAGTAASRWRPAWHGRGEQHLTGGGKASSGRGRLTYGAHRTERDTPDMSELSSKLRQVCLGSTLYRELLLGSSIFRIFPPAQGFGLQRKIHKREGNVPEKLENYFSQIGQDFIQPFQLV